MRDEAQRTDRSRPSSAKFLSRLLARVRSLCLLVSAYSHPHLALLLATGVSVWAGDHVITPADIANLRKVSDAQISPDGRLAAYVVETPVKAGDQRNAHIWLTSNAEHPFVMSSKSDTHPRWSPDGEILAFLSDRKHVEQVWAIRLDGGEAYQLTDVPGGVKAFKWSRDGKSIGFIHRDQDTPEEKARKETKEDQILVNENYKFDRLWTYDVASHASRQVTKGDVNVDDFDWSPDGRQVIARLSPTPVLNDYWYVSKVVLVAMDSGEITRTLTMSAAPEAVLWAESGNRVLYGEHTAKGISGWFVLQDLTSGKVVTIGAGLKASLHALAWDATGQNLTAQGVEGTRTFFGKVDAATGAVEKLADVPAEGYGFTESRDGETLAYVGQTPSHPDDVWIYAKESGAKPLADSNPQVAS